MSQNIKQNQGMNGLAILSSLVNMQEEISSTGLAKTLSATDRNGKELYKARGIDAVYNLLSPLFCKHKIVVGFNCISKEREAVKTQYSIQYQTFVTVDYIFTSAIDGSKHEVRIIGEAFDHSDKGIAKALSMAYKYACFQVFNIPVCDDPDSIVHDKISNEDYEQSLQHVQHTTTQLNNGQQRNNRNNNQRQNNQQGKQQFISENQASYLVEQTRAAGFNPQKLFKRFNIERFGQMSIHQYNDALQSLQNYLKEQQQINQQTQQFESNQQRNTRNQRGGNNANSHGRYS
ncbi:MULTISPECIES: ERF family protein [Acinetobacter]|uniref:ERF family protein n=1 Tax=Acinetobacter TaxID=469 RepID=UPI001F0700AE|nr:MULTISPECIES: ERF family protein [Acinetobacter]MCH2003665.1 ERF family protein [Acinetobacter seifertii]WQF74946.1 ERF family protein [Acinetobacter oleivorans]